MANFDGYYQALGVGGTGVDDENKTVYKRGEIL